jgi:hypothetical protein
METKNYIERLKQAERLLARVQACLPMVKKFDSLANTCSVERGKIEQLIDDTYETEIPSKGRTITLSIEQLVSEVRIEVPAFVRNSHLQEHHEKQNEHFHQFESELRTELNKSLLESLQKALDGCISRHFSDGCESHHLNKPRVVLKIGSLIGSFEIKVV